MALQDKKFLDLPGLQTYDTLIKAYIPSADETTITLNSDNEFELKNIPTVNGEVLEL
jgi:hypothetical protein